MSSPKKIKKDIEKVMARLKDNERFAKSMSDNRRQEENILKLLIREDKKRGSSKVNPKVRIVGFKPSKAGKTRKTRKPRKTRKYKKRKGKKSKSKRNK
jgi:hypothetical protein